MNIYLIIFINMWSNYCSDVNIIKNFHVAFSNDKNDVQMKLSEWQYWWWFWFALLWSLYFLILIRCVFLRKEVYAPVNNTSLRGHGKWGDFIVALIPTVWCWSIVLNSNFIFRMIELQNESSCMTIRVQGKQWYWVYKYNYDTHFKLMSLYRNVGNNNWIKINQCDDYAWNTNLMSIQFDNEFLKKHTSNILSLKNSNNLSKNNFSNENKYLKNKNKFKLLSNKYIKNNLNFNFILKNTQTIFKTNEIFNINNKKITNLDKYFTLFFFKSNLINFQFFDILDDSEEVSSNLKNNTNYNFRLQKGLLNKQNFFKIKNKLNNIFFKFQIVKPSIQDKVLLSENFWGFRQKKYKKLTSFDNKINYSNENFKENNILNYNIKKKIIYNFIKSNRKRHETISNSLSRRLLRTKRTLTLPVHLNITVITGSYDVVHSWFIPGLGLKLDCVPGRSTHHTFFIDNVGFYYGQCAEICGRYHHHMPIRVCALKFEHFMSWWKSKGFARLHRDIVYTNLITK